MTDFRAELQLLSDAAESFAESALGHQRPWVTALNRARAALAEQPVGQSRRCIYNPVQIAECGGPCEQIGPEACDCGALWVSQDTAQPVAIGPEWQPCVKMPITVHVREQRPGETHSNTREGLTPLLPDDLIMRGVQGEEYPIGRELFEQTYRMGTNELEGPTDKELRELWHDGWDTTEEFGAFQFARAVLAHWGQS
jgi:hypothetical protein